MKIARELSLNVSLKELVEKQLDVLQNEKVKVVFYKEEGRWQTNVIVLQEGNTVSERDLKTLKWIKSVDRQAVVMEKRDFKRDWEDELVTLEEMVGTIEYRYNQMDCHNNISEFLEKYAEEKQQQKVDRSSLKEVVKHCWDRLWKKRYSNAVFWKKNECWDYHIFFLSENNVIPREDEVLLRGIQKEDNNAIVIDGYSYRYLDGDGVAGYIANEIEKYHQDKCNGHNIGAFLDNYSWEAVQKKEKQEQEEQQRHWTMERSEIVEIMEKELKKLRDLSTQCTALDKSCMISNAMLKIAKYLTYEQEW
jgi:hypothetical protein